MHWFQFEGHTLSAPLSILYPPQGAHGTLYRVSKGVHESVDICELSVVLHRAAVVGHKLSSREGNSSCGLLTW